MPISSKSTIKRESLERLAEERLSDFDALCKEKRFPAAIYLGVYSVECLLKAHICKALDLDELPETYKSHHLLTLLLHSGLNRRIRTETGVFNNLRKLDGMWNPADEDRNIRYIDDPIRYGETQAESVRGWMLDSKTGVITWLRSQL